jgi:hypothetical protein
MIELRKNDLALLFNEQTAHKVETLDNYMLSVEHKLNNLSIISFCNFDDEISTINLPQQGVRYQKLIYSAEERWGGPEQIMPSSITSDKIKINEKSMIILKTLPKDE